MLTQFERLKLLIPDEKNDSLLKELLTQAEDAIKQRRRAVPESKLEDCFKTLQVRIAVFLYDKMGAEGEIVHNENGTSRTYENAHIPESMLSTITPLGVVVS